jgi:hypothetical protein
MRLYKTLLVKAYFDKGASILNYVLKVLTVIGIGGAATKTFSLDLILLFSFLFVLICLGVGFCWYKFNIVETENEIGNMFNPFCKEVRKELKIKPFKA